MSKYNRINWQTGMEITPQVLTDADNFHIEQQNLIREQQNLIRRLQVMPCYGLLPENNTFNVNVSIEGGRLVIKNLTIQAITPQGELIDEQGKEYVINDFNQNISELYITLPNFQVFENLDNNFCMPIAKINNNYLDYNYILPCISINSNKKLLEIYDEICEKVSKIIEQIKEQIKIQEKYKPIFLPLSLLELELKSYSKFESPAELFLLVKKVAMIFKTSEVLELENIEKLLNETYCHTNIHTIFSIVLECLRELEEKTIKKARIVIQIATK